MKRESVARWLAVRRKVEVTQPIRHITLGLRSLDTGVFVIQSSEATLMDL